MPRDTVVFRPTTPNAGGWVEVNPVFASRFAALGIDSATGFLELPGEVVSGHPDRHVLRVELPGIASAFYLKRQHSVSYSERLRNWRAGFGWASKCEREAKLLKELAARELPVPHWVAFGEDPRGRAFLLVEEVCGTDLRHVLSDNVLSLAERRELATHLGKSIARFHDSGFTTPDLTAKHVLVSPQGELTLIDWQSSRRVASVSESERLAALAALHASLANDLAAPRERLCVLRAAMPQGEQHAASIEQLAKRLRDRRSIRDQRQPVVTASAQRLVWLAEEAVCAVPEVAAIWPRPAVAAPFYGCEPGSLVIRLADGRDAMLIRGKSFAPVGRLKAKLRGRPWRSPGVTLGRVLFHLERYGVPAPRLLAFGQRLTGLASAEWFALHELPGKAITDTMTTDTAEQIGRLLRKLHDAGCRTDGGPLAAFGQSDFGVSVRDVTRIRLVRKVSQADRNRELCSLLTALPAECRTATEAGYRQNLLPNPHDRMGNLVPAKVG